jgi:site-specific recombinase XerD
MNKVPLHTVQKLLGHANIKTTEQYAHLSPDYLKDSLEGVDF